MFHESAFVTVRSFSTEAEAQLACQRLKEGGLNTYVANTAAQMVVGGGSVYPCELKVRIKDVEKAQAILEVEVVAERDAYEAKFENRRKIAKIIFVVGVGGPLLISMIQSFFGK